MLRYLRMAWLGLQSASFGDDDSQSMPYAMHPYIQLIPDWMIGGVLRCAAWGAAGSGVILGMIADTPPALVALIGGVFGVAIALINRSATRERENMRIHALDAEVAILKTRLVELSGTLRTPPGYGHYPPNVSAITDTPPRADVGGTTNGLAG